MDTVPDRMAFAAAVLEICREQRGSVTSWYRTAARNRVVRGASMSLHLVGLAMDVVFDPRPSEAEIYRAIMAAGLHYLKEPTHVHIQALPFLPGSSDG